MIGAVDLRNVALAVTVKAGHSWGELQSIEEATLDGWAAELAESGKVSPSKNPFYISHKHKTAKDCLETKASSSSTSSSSTSAASSSTASMNKLMANEIAAPLPLVRSIFGRDDDNDDDDNGDGNAAKKKFRSSSPM